MPSDSPLQHTLTRRSMLGLTGGLVAAALAGCSDPRLGVRATMAAPAATTSHATPLRQWYHQYGEAGTRRAVEGYAAQFHRARVEVGWMAGDYDLVVRDALGTDVPPDVFEYGNGPSIEMLRSGQVADLTDVIGDAVRDFDPVFVKRFTYRDRIWAIPQIADVQVLFYRPSMLAAAGVRPPDTVAALLDAAGALTTRKVKGLFVGNDGGAGILGPLMLRSAGLDLLTPDGNIGFDEPAAAPALAMVRTLATSGHVLRDAPSDWYSPTAFVQGLTPMQLTGLWNLPSIVKAWGEDVGVLPWPALPGGTVNVPVGGYGACVNAGSRQLSLAKEFVKWLWVDRVDLQTDFTTAYGLHLPVRGSVTAAAPVFRGGLAADARQLATRHGFIQTHLLWNRRCQTAFDDMMSRIVMGGADPGAELGHLRTLVDDELRRQHTA